MNRGTKRVRVIVAFGDIRGFGIFSQRVDDEETQSIPFFVKYDKLVEDLKRDIGNYLEDTGDGFISIIEIGEDHGCQQAAKLLRSLGNFYVKVERLIKRWKTPRPDGYRIRVTCGHVLKTPTVFSKPIYRGKNINLAHEMLAVEKDTPIICHESVKQLLSETQAKKAKLRFSHLRDPGPNMDGIYKNEMPFLWELRVK